MPPKQGVPKNVLALNDTNALIIDKINGLNCLLTRLMVKIYQYMMKKMAPYLNEKKCFAEMQSEYMHFYKCSN